MLWQCHGGLKINFHEGRERHGSRESDTLPGMREIGTEIENEILVMAGRKGEGETSRQRERERETERWGDRE